ncbi:MAG TPA: PQQ-binding-like beta-propeller repeat protein [Ktedonobacteraceae bacterium]|jgi:outer membrane protein assembly factor BamB|nr:PQQ-binding-like beta-propeller repeat protein [Ktedonobacteraceae bacterium]
MKKPLSSLSKILAPVSILLVMLALVMTGFTHLWPAGAAPAGHTNIQSTTVPHVMKIHGTNEHNTAAPPPVQYHGGPVMRQTITYAIFWEPPTLQDGTPARVSNRYNRLLMGYFNDVGGTELYDNNTQYYDNSGHIVNSSAFGAAWVDTSPYPPSGCSYLAMPANCLNDAQIQAEVARAMDVNGWAAGLNHIFYVYTARKEGSCLDSSSKSCAFTNYCAYHSTFSIDGQTVIYANIPYAGTDLAACGVPYAPNGSLDSDSAINITSHEQMEAVTDPQLNAWYNAEGEEIGDICAWNFNDLRLNHNTANVDWQNHFYIVQREWSNVFGQCILRGQLGTVLVTTYNGDLCNLNTNDGYTRWCYATPRIQGSSPTLANGVVYFGSDDGYVNAVHELNGKLAWRYKTDSQLVTSSPVVQDGVVYVASSSLYALNAGNGSLLWKHRFKYGAASSPAVVNGIIYINEGDGYLYALNAGDGSIVWQYKTEMYVYSTAPTVVNGVVYAGSTNHTLYALNAGSGSLLWSYQTGGAIYSSAAVSDGIVYIGSADGSMYALNAADGSLIWRYTTGDSIYSSPSAVNGVVYFGSNDDFVYALNAGSGSLLWRYQTGGRVFSSPQVVNGLLYIGSEDSYVYTLNTIDGTLSWRTQMGGSVYTTPFVHLRILGN